jgi:quinol monooxygenase YgiN
VLIVGGTFEMEPEQREKFLLGRHDAMRQSRAETGCLEYTLSADPIDPGRVVLFERWESQADLDAHLSTQRTAPRAPGGVAPTSVSVMIYDIAGERPLS